MLESHCQNVWEEVRGAERAGTTFGARMPAASWADAFVIAVGNPRVLDELDQDSVMQVGVYECLSKRTQELMSLPSYMHSYSYEYANMHGCARAHTHTHTHTHTHVLIAVGKRTECSGCGWQRS